MPLRKGDEEGILDFYYILRRICDALWVIDRGLRGLPGEDWGRAVGVPWGSGDGVWP